MRRGKRGKLFVARVGVHIAAQGKVAAVNAHPPQRVAQPLPRVKISAEKFLLRRLGQLLEKEQVCGVNFTRAGYSGAQKYAIHWTGDQCSCFSEYRAQLAACLSAGLSGVLFMGFDLAGFAGGLSTLELYCRSVSLAAFSALMQFHSEPTQGANNDRNPWNMARCMHAPWLNAYFRHYADLRMQLMPYLAAEAHFCAQNARPLMEHLVLDWPGDPAPQACHTQYMLGRSCWRPPCWRRAHWAAPCTCRQAAGKARDERRAAFPTQQWTGPALFGQALSIV